MSRPENCVDVVVEDPLLHLFSVARRVDRAKDIFSSSKVMTAFCVGEETKGPLFRTSVRQQLEPDYSLMPFCGCCSERRTPPHNERPAEGPLSASAAAAAMLKPVN